MDIIISKEIEAKIGAEDHGCISRKEVVECFQNHCGKYALDPRPQHLDSNGNPCPWFVAETNQKKLLKITFVLDGGKYYLKSAYPANDRVKNLYLKLTR